MNSTIHRRKTVTQNNKEHRILYIQEAKIVIRYTRNNEEKRRSVMSVFSRKSPIKQNYRKLCLFEILLILLKVKLRKQAAGI
jgi:hypothetical protein